MIDLKGRTALITGSTQGVGQAIALALAKAGADVVLHGLELDQQAEDTARRCRQLGAEVHAVAADLAGPTQQCGDALLDEALRLAPKIDLLVNNAGTYCDDPLLEMAWEKVERTMRLNVFSYFYLTQQLAKHWVQHDIEGRVLMVGSINGQLAEPTHAAYDTSKGAVEMMVRSMCVELAPRRIRVNGVAPGLFRTPLTQPALDDPQLMQWMQHHTPNGEVPGPDAVGAAAVFLLSDQAWHVHGQMLRVDGGMSVWQQPDPPQAAS